jgi:hypothetical protein
MNMKEQLIQRGKSNAGEMEEEKKEAREKEAGTA